ncbi:MAG: tetratricopeptide repeat protein, partial [Desulfovermiculus sp.]|nr:tetratricopeptide repeat protein [Desulfovermiculus sp.]
MKKISVRLTVLSVLSLILLVPPPAICEQASCEKWMAKFVSVQGQVQVKRHNQNQWTPVSLNDTCCPQDTVRILENSRAAILLPNETILRLKESTTFTIEHPDREKSFWFKLLRGALHFFSRTPWSLKFSTPFVNGVVEGTEFFVQVKEDRTFLSVFEGRVVSENTKGRLTLTSGQTAETLAGQAPRHLDMPSCRDCVHWAVYYPPILDYRPSAFPQKTQLWHQIIDQAIQSFQAGDPSQAISLFNAAPDHVRDADFYALQAGVLLAVGNITGAEQRIDLALAEDAHNCPAVALGSIIALAQNREAQALDQARQALRLDDRCPAGYLALSYALQSRFDLQGALKALLKAKKADPGDALTSARLAELWLSLGELDRALEAARRAVSLNPELAKTQTILGFAYLMQFQTEEAIQHFQTAIRLDQGDPLPRLGLGIAQIREGNLKNGRTEIEIAVSLDPTNSLLRSYLGKAYYDEKRSHLAAAQYEQAKDLDPNDPTPWFYDAIRKQTMNRPVEALQDLQQSIRLNDNRAVYRSRLLLDEDLAARSAALGRIYKDLGFEHLAFLQGWKSLTDDPANFSAHRLLADTYSARPRHEIARVSELLQSQLLQPLNVTPIQPHLAESNVYLLEGS